MTLLSLWRGRSLVFFSPVVAISISFTIAITSVAMICIMFVITVISIISVLSSYIHANRVFHAVGPGTEGTSLTWRFEADEVARQS
ncbi:hypothetical protein E4U47_001001 [Claviceps purpurea]|nr:hypothetical protein E4U36_004691 [Claviceps purpurea]KAG6213708.1 hypothetical protein E4U50_001006 [Claviceps purpurea]KAG6275220.1 hypothetical protein E4U47_001001 [Claviceps purpurea]